MKRNKGWGAWGFLAVLVVGLAFMDVLDAVSELVSHRKISGTTVGDLEFDGAVVLLASLIIWLWQLRVRLRGRAQGQSGP